MLGGAEAHLGDLDRLVGLDGALWQPPKPRVPVIALRPLGMWRVDGSHDGGNSLMDDYLVDGEPGESEMVTRAVRTLSDPRSSPASTAAAAATLSAIPASWVLSRVREACDAARASRTPDGHFLVLFAVCEELAKVVEVMEEEARREQAAAEEERARRFGPALEVLLSRESLPSDREAARDDVLAWDLGDRRELAARVQTALDGDWRVVTSREDTVARRGLGRWFEELAPTLGLRVDIHLPEVDQLVVADCEDARPGRLRSTVGLGIYDLHQEWPIDGSGVRKDRILVIDGEKRTPIIDWLRARGVRVLCPHCGGFLDRRVEVGCPARAHRPGG